MSKNNIVAIVDVTCFSEREFGFDKIAMNIARFPEVETVAVVSGKADLMVKLTTTSLEAVSKFVTEVLAPMSGVQSTATHFFMKTYKLNGSLLFDEPKPSRLPISA